MQEEPINSNLSLIVIWYFIDISPFKHISGSKIKVYQNSRVFFITLKFQKKIIKKIRLIHVLFGLYL